MDQAGSPLSTLLSQALVAFTIEFDNEFEHRMPHRTTNHGGQWHAPWLVSLAMWSNCMAFVGEDGVRLDELEELARTSTNLNGMVRWGYIVIGPGKIVRATPAGQRAQEIWRPLFGEIEERWVARFGEGEIEHLRKSLLALVSQIDLDLPDCLPILGYGLFSKVSDRARRAPVGSDLALPALLSRALLAFAIEFEREPELSLAICANVLRVLDEKGVRVRDIPLPTGVSKESIAVAMGILRKKGVAVVEKNVARLTPKGREAQDAYRQRIGVIEERWQTRFGEDTIRTLRDLLGRLAGELFRGLEPYSDGWRASVRRPNTLPHYPMVLHRGGFPDGS
jgi:DNA-binding MarR family transcriptional regulator